MTLQAAEAKVFWDLFRESSLFRSWPEFEQQVPTHVDVIEMQGNQSLFEPGTPAEHLYLVGEGTILQTYGSAGQLWYQRNLGTGDVVGQRALFAGRHSTLRLLRVRLWCTGSPLPTCAVHWSGTQIYANGCCETRWRAACTPSRCWRACQR